MRYKQHTACRVCGSTALATYLDLGMMPLSNNLCSSKDEEPERYPLKLMLCKHCCLSQLSIVVDPNIMFSNYVYRSGISQGYKDHCKQMARDLSAWGINGGSFHIDIAGNDGTLLKQFRTVLGGRGKGTSINVDPAQNFMKDNRDAGIVQHATFWSRKAAETWAGLADLITATNVFAHVDDVRDFLEGAKLALNKTGILVLEFPYIVDFIQKQEFDTIYFEHLSYFSLSPLVSLANELGLIVLDAEWKEIHGGSLRVIIGKTGQPSPRVNALMERESVIGMHKWETYEDWGDEIRFTIIEVRETVRHLATHSRIGAFAASAKGNTLLNACGLTGKEIEYIIDETPEKIGKFSPGTGIEIVPLNFPTRWPDYMLILAWNFKDEIMDKCTKLGYRGRYILPLTLEIITKP